MAYEPASLNKDGSVPAYERGRDWPVSAETLKNRYDLDVTHNWFEQNTPKDAGTLPDGDLAMQNARLAQENARLRSQLSRDDKRMEALPYPGDTLRADSTVYSYIPATVVKNAYAGERNYLVLDRGQKDGVEPDMGVVTADGVLGVVVQVTPRYSVCRSILHTDSYISARFAKNEYFGTVEWDGKDRRYVRLVNIPRQAEVAVGDTVITDRRSTLFPEGLVVGTVQEAEVGDASDFYDIRVCLADDLAAVRHVYILRYRYKDELQQALQYDD